MVTPVEDNVNTEAESYILSPKLNQRMARIGAVVVNASMGLGLAILGCGVAVESRDVVARGLGVALALAGTAFATAISVLYFQGDPDFSPHRMHPTESPVLAQQEPQV